MNTPAIDEGRHPLLGIGALLIGVFFAVIGVLVVQAPIDKAPALAGWLLRGFGLSIFGGIAAVAFLAARSCFRGDRPAIPEAVRARCPACGARWGAGADACACGQARAACDAAWQEIPREGATTLFFGGAIGSGLLCLGLFMAVASLAGEERRSLMIIAYLALALLLIAVGGLMLFGASMYVRATLREIGVRRFKMSFADGARSVAAEATVDRRGADLRGTGARFTAVDRAPAVEPAPAAIPPPVRALIRAVAVLHARGEASLTFVERCVWSVEASELSSTLSTEVMIDTAPPRVVTPSDDEDALAVPPPFQPSDARDIVLVAVSADPALTSLARSIAAGGPLANAVETFAARLSHGEADGHVLAVLTAVAAAGMSSPPPAPYRAAA